MVVQVAPAQICKLPAPSLKIVSTCLVALKFASTVEAVVLVKLEVVTAVPCRAKVLAVTVPLIAGSDAIVTLLEMDAVTEPIWAVPATNVGRVAKETGWVVWKNVPLTGTVPEIEAVTVLPIVTVPAIVCVPVGLAVTVPAIVTVLPTVTVPEMGSALDALKATIASLMFSRKFPSFIFAERKFT